MSANAGLMAWQAERRAVRAEGEANMLASQRLWEAGRDERARQAKERASALQRQRRARRRAAERLRAPAWADREAIKAVYIRAQQVSAATGIPHHVDHYYPLCGRLVSGLHVAENLQILTASDNMSKHNRFEVDA